VPLPWVIDTIVASMSETTLFLVTVLIPIPRCGRMILRVVMLGLIVTL
jgi:hypothetical protein